MTMYRRLLIVALMLAGLDSASAQQTLPPGQIDAAGNITWGPLPIGSWLNNKLTLKPDAIQLQGTGSTGDVSGMSVPLLGGTTTTLGKALPTLDITRAEIATQTIPLRAFTVSGFAASGDAGAGARYVRGTSTGPFAIQDAAGTWFQLDLSAPVIPASWAGVVANDPNKAAQNGAALNGLMSALASVGGGTIRLQAGWIWTDRTIDNRYDYMLLIGAGRRINHDTGNSGPATTLVPNGAFTVLRHRTPTAAGRGVLSQDNWRTTGGGFVNIAVRGNGLSPRLLHVTSSSYAEYTVYLENGVGTEAALFDTLPDYRSTSNSQMGEASDNQHNRIDLDIRQEAGPLTGASNGVNFSGTPGSGNSSLDFGIKVRVHHAEGIGVLLTNADNLEFSDITEQQVNGSGRAILAQAGPAGFGVGQIVIRHLTATGPSHVETLAERAGAVSQSDLDVIYLDSGNGTPFPSGPNITVENTGYSNYQTVNKSIVGLSIGNSASAAAMARSLLAGNPVYTFTMSNDSNSGPAFIGTDNTIWAQRYDVVSQNWQFLGPKTHEFGTPVKINGGVGFNGATPTGKCTLSQALPTDGGASSAALATAINAIRACLITNGLGQ